MSETKGRKKNPEGRMALKDHLIELRNRFFKCAVAILLGAVVGWILYNGLVNDAAAPILAISRERGLDAKLNYDGVSTSFDLKIQVSMFLGAIIASPIWIYQLWAFVTPGLTRKERKYTLAYMFSAIPLFVAGVYVGWLIMPNIVLALTSFTPSGPASSNLIPAADYLDFIMQLMLFMGIAFLVPVVLVGVNAAGIIRGHTYLKAWRVTILAITIVSAMAAPGADAFSMFFLAAPLLALYFGAIGLCILNDKRRDRKVAKSAEETDVTADTATPVKDLGTL